MKYNSYDDQELTAFVLNESRISTDDREVDEHSPESVFEFDDESIHNYYKLRNDAEAL